MKAFTIVIEKVANKADVIEFKTNNRQQIVPIGTIKAEICNCDGIQDECGTEIFKPHKLLPSAEEQLKEWIDFKVALLDDKPAPKSTKKQTTTRGKAKPRK